MRGGWLPLLALQAHPGIPLDPCNIKMKNGSTETNSIQLALFKTPLILPPSACQKGPWSLPRICLLSASTVIRKNVPDVKPQLTLYLCLLIQTKCQPSQQMLSISREVMEPLGSNGTPQCGLCFPAYCFTRDKNKITYSFGTWFKLNCYGWLTYSTQNGFSTE